MTPEQTLAFIGFAVVMAATPGPSNTLLTALGAQVGVRRGLPALFGVAAGMAVMMFTVSVGLGALLVNSPLLLMAIRIAGAALLLWLAWKIATARVSASELSQRPANPSEPLPPGPKRRQPTTPVAKSLDAPTPVVGSLDAPTPVVSSLDAPTPVVKPLDALTPVVKPLDAPTPVAKPLDAPTPVVKPQDTPTRMLKPRAVGFVGAAVFQWVNPKSWLASASAAAAFSAPTATSAPIHAAAVAAIFACTAIPCCLPWLAFGAALQRLLHSPRAQRTFNLSMAALLCLSVAVLFAT